MRDHFGSDHYAIALAGEYDIARKQELATTLAGVTNGKPVSIDMHDVTYVDSTFLSELAAMRLRLNERPVTLIGVQGNVARIMRLAKLDRFFIFRSTG